MDQEHLREMKDNLYTFAVSCNLADADIYLFGVCNATQELYGLLSSMDIIPCAILDNNELKHGSLFLSLPVIYPQEMVRREDFGHRKIVLIASRAYDAMASQLRGLGFEGRIEKLVDYNSFSEYSLSDDTRRRKKERLVRGLAHRQSMMDKYPDYFRLICPFNALGDVCFALSYFPYYYQKRGISEKYVVFVVGKSCADVAAVYGTEYIEMLSQSKMDELVQAEIYSRSADAYIAHHDRPYTSTAHKALKIKKFTLEEIYRYGVYGLDESCKAIEPSSLSVYEDIEEIPEHKSVIFSPYAKSSANIRESYWTELIQTYSEMGYTLFTNADGYEKALEGTTRISAPLSAMRSIVERAGTFIGLRSGLCDVIHSATCKKVALYPDNYYSDTQWKTKEIFYLDGWENIVVL